MVLDRPYDRRSSSYESLPMQPTHSTSFLRGRKISGYRFCTSDIAEAMLEHGSIKVSSPAEYWESDGTIGGRSDPREARRRWVPQSGPLSDYATKKMHENLPNWKPGDPMAKIRIMEGAEVVLQTRCYMFCFSNMLGGTLVRKMADTFGYNACVRINDLVDFASELSNSMPKLKEFSKPNWPSGRFLIGGVHYEDIPDDPPEYPGVDLFAKSTPYRWQREGRIVWRGSGSIDPIIQRVPGIKRLLEPVDLSPFGLASASTKV